MSNSSNTSANNPLTGGITPSVANNNQIVLSNIQKPVLQTNIKLNQSVSNSMSNTLTTTSLSPMTLAAPVTVLPQNQVTLLTGSINNNANLNSSSSYGGFAHCSNCGDYGVKAAFYGKSKLYCSVACQNGIKKQQQQSQGTKRTIESLNYSSSNNSTNNSPILTNSTIQMNSTTLPASLVPITGNKSQVASDVNQNNQIYVHLNTNTNVLKAPDSVATNETCVAQQQVNELIQIQSNNETTQSGNQMVLQLNANSIVTKSEASIPLASTIPQQSQTNNVNFTNTNGNAEPSSKRARNNSNSSSTSMSCSTISLQNPISNFDSTTLSINPPSKVAKFQWSAYIDEHPNVAAPVDAFKHVPLYDFWRKISNNMIVVEVPNLDLPPDLVSDSKSGGSTCYWFALVIQFAGYLVKLRYFGYDDDPKNDFWMHLCDESLHPVGWTAENDVSLVPPETIIEKQEDWRQYAIDKLVGFITLPKDFHKKVANSLTSRFKKNMLLEVIDKYKVSSMRVARIIDNIGGRLRLKYENSDDFDDFWCHQNSELIHPIGWSASVGHDITASEEYKKKSALKLEKNSYESNECCPDMFRKIPAIDNSLKKVKHFRSGMKLEAIDPLNLSQICVASVAKCLRDEYLMVKIDGYTNDLISDQFCYHRTSSSILPAGFCQRNSLKLKEPFGYKGKFKWKNYLSATNSEFAPQELFNQGSGAQNPFKIGMKLESVDLMEPKMVCVATVIAIVDRLIRVNFDGWDRAYDQWIDFESCDIYPVGWCQLVNYNLEPPKDDQDSKVKKDQKVRVKGKKPTGKTNHGS